MTFLQIWMVVLPSLHPERSMLLNRIGLIHQVQLSSSFHSHVDTFFSTLPELWKMRNGPGSRELAGLTNRSTNDGSFVTTSSTWGVAILVSTFYGNASQRASRWSFPLDNNWVSRAKNMCRTPPGTRRHLYLWTRLSLRTFLSLWNYSKQ